MATTVENLKGFVTFLREGIVVVVLLLFLILPGAMNSVLSRAGFTKASLAGFEWELRDAIQNTSAATEDVTKLAERLDSLNSRLDQISQSPATSPQVRQEITNLSQEFAQVRSDTRIAQSALKQSLAVQRSIIQRVDPRILQPTEPVRPKQPVSRRSPDQR